MVVEQFQCPWPACLNPFRRHTHVEAKRHIELALAAGVWMCPWNACQIPYNQAAHTHSMLAAHQVNAGLALEPGVQMPSAEYVEPARTSVLAGGSRPRPAGRELRRVLVESESGNTVRNLVFGRLHETTPIYDSVVRDLGVDPVCMRLEDGFAKLLQNGIMKPPENVRDVNHLFSL